MHSTTNTRIPRFTMVWAVLMITPLMTGCFTRWAYDHGITRYEGFKAPTRVLVSRADGSIAIEVESFLYSPAEAAKYFDRETPDRPFWERIPDRPMHRRFLIASAEKMEKLIDHGSQSAFHDTDPPDTLTISIYLMPLQARNERQVLFPHWNIIPSGFDAPSVAESDLPVSFAGGYDAYPWQDHEAKRVSGNSDRYYHAWNNPVPWKTRDGRHWKLSFSLVAYPKVARHERPPSDLDRYKPFFWVADLITGPIQIIAAPILYGLTCG